jgi:hypothetical protein
VQSAMFGADAAALREQVGHFEIFNLIYFFVSIYFFEENNGTDNFSSSELN